MQRTRYAILFQPDLDSARRILLRPDMRNPVLGKSVERDFFQLVDPQPSPGYRQRNRRSIEHVVEFDPKPQSAAADADDEQIQPDSDSAPQMNLKQGAASPYVLWSTPQPLEKG